MLGNYHERLCSYFADFTIQFILFLLYFCTYGQVFVGLDLDTSVLFVWKIVLILTQAFHALFSP